MSINLFPYPNLCKAEKIKPTPRIIQKYFYSVYLTHQSDTNSRKTVYSKVIVLTASDWCSSVIVTNVFFAFVS